LKGLLEIRKRVFELAVRKIHDADVVQAQGLVGFVARVALDFRRAEVPTELANNQFLVVQTGDSLWRIARRALGQGPL